MKILYKSILWILLFQVTTAQASKEEAMQRLRTYYIEHIDKSYYQTSCVEYLDKLDTSGAFVDGVDYEQEIVAKKLLEKVSFDDQQKLGFYLTDIWGRLGDLAAYFRKSGVEIPERYWKAILHYGTIELKRQPNDRFHASCFAIPKAACKVYFNLWKCMEQIESGCEVTVLEKEAHDILRRLAMQSWTQPLRNDATDCNVVSVERFRHHVWWVGGNALAYRPLLETAVLMDSIPMVDVVAEVAQKSLSYVSQNTYTEAFWNEGFTADGAGWGHGMQALVWGYPIHGASSALNILKVLRGTPWATVLTRDNALALLNFYRGSNFYYYKGYIPPCLDRYSMVYYDKQHQPIPYYNMLKATINDWSDSFTQEEQQELKTLLREAGRESICMANYPAGMYHGCRWFFNNDDFIKKTPRYHIMVNMASVRCDGLESASNFADEFNIFTNDGVTLMQRNGDEHRKIIGAMDFTALPGITAREGMERLKPITNWRGFCSKYNFAAGATSGKGNGVAAFIFEKMNATSKEKDVPEINPTAFGIKAYKSYFFLGDYMVALGAGVTNLRPELEGNIRTTIEQTALQNEVFLFDGKKRLNLVEKQGLLDCKRKPLWMIQNNGFAYTLLPQYSPIASYSIEIKPNDWLKRNLTNKGKSNLPDSAAIFRLWLDHGRSVQNGNYGYAVYCGEGVPNNKMPFTVLRNDTLVQAVASMDSKIIAASFYCAGENIKIGKKEITVSEPCTLLIEQEEGEIIFSVADARMDKTVKQIVINYGKQRVVVDMPQKERIGAVAVCKKTIDFFRKKQERY